MPDNPVKRVSVEFEGRPCEGTTVEVEQSIGRWSVVTLTDGSVIKIQAVVTEVIMLDGKFDPDGQPIYMVRSHNSLSVVSPPHLLKDAADSGVH